MSNVTSPPSCFQSHSHINPSPFRQLNEMERMTIERARSKGKIPYDDLRLINTDELAVSYERMQGGFTVCVLIIIANKDSTINPQLWRGASRRSYKDARNPVRGEMLAFSRAILYSRPASL